MTCRLKCLSVVFVGLALVAAACSSDDAGDGTAAPPDLSTTSTTVATATTSAAPTTTTSAPATTTTQLTRSALDLSGLEVAELSDEGAGAPATSRAEELVGTGYVEAEYLVSGLADLYSGPATGPAVVAEEDVAYTTRILVRVPEDPRDFSGRVLIEPFNTSGGAENDTPWSFLQDALIGNGDAWIGVTERVSSVGALNEFDADRYSDLQLTSNGQAWDILSQVGALVKEGNAPSPLAEFDIDRLYMTGYSQNGVEISTYASAIHPLARMADGSGIYDGYLVMGRAASMTPLDSGDAALPGFELDSIAAVDVPTLELLTETDVRGFSDPLYQNTGGAAVRRPDSNAEGDKYRLWEIPGSAHAPMIAGCNGGGTTFPTARFVEAAYASLIEWAGNDVAPPVAERIEIAAIGDVVAEIERDELGNALGGVRSPYVDVPLASYAPTDTPGPLCGLAGVETPLDRETLESLYADVADYLTRFEESLDEVVAAGFLLGSDVDEILTEAEMAAAAALAPGSGD